MSRHQFLAVHLSSNALLPDTNAWSLLPYPRTAKAIKIKTHFQIPVAFPISFTNPPAWQIFTLFRDPAYFPFLLLHDLIVVAPNTINHDKPH